jgi:hypothetical protein
MEVSMNRKFNVDFDKLSKRDKTMLYEIIADYVVEHELPEDVAPHDGETFDFGYTIQVDMEIY